MAAEHVPIRILRPGDVELPRVVDPRYVGNSVSRFAPLLFSRDGELEVGVWRLAGGHTTPLHEGYEEVLVVVEGALVLGSGAAEQIMQAGDVALLDCPVPPMRVEAREPVTAVYAIRHRRAL